MWAIDWRTGLFAGGFLNTCEARDVVAMGAAALFIRRTDAPDWNNAFINFDYKDLFKAPNCQITEKKIELTQVGDGCWVIAITKSSTQGSSLACSDLEWLFKSVSPPFQVRFKSVLYFEDIKVPPSQYGVCKVVLLAIEQSRDTRETGFRGLTILTKTRAETCLSED